MIYRQGIVGDRLVNAIDACRIFETSFNFWDADGDGWDVLENTPGWNVSLSTTMAETTVAFFSWLVKSSSRDIKDNFIEEKVGGAIYLANDNFADFVELLLGLRPAGTLHDDAGLLQLCSDLLFRHITLQNWKIVNSLLAWGADPHRVYTDKNYSPVAESPLSLAMYSSWTFCAFRNASHGRDLDVKDFARKELKEGRPLHKSGWQMETLTALLEFEFEPDIAPNNGRSRYWCDSCNRYMWSGQHCFEIMVQPYWESFLESVKSGVSPHDLCSITQDEQPSDSQRNLTVLSDSSTDTTDDSELSQDPALSEDQAAHPDQESRTYGVDISSTIFHRKEIWCIECWYHFKKTGRRWSSASETESSDEDDTSEDDFSPYLIHT